MQTYYNTNQLSGEALKKAVADARNSQEAIMLIFQNTAKPYSPSVIYTLMLKAGKKYPITSVRRAMTNLQQAGLLIKTSNLVPGLYGKPEHQWMLK